MNRLDFIDDSTQWVWSVHMSLEWLTWFLNDEKNIENSSIKQCGKVSMNPCIHRKVIAGYQNLVYSYCVRQIWSS